DPGTGALPSLSMSSATGYQGETVEIAVSLNPGEYEIESYNILLAYSVDSFEYVSAAQKQEQVVAEELIVDPDVKNGIMTVKVAGFKNSETISVEQEIFTINFKIKNSAYIGDHTIWV